MIRIVYVFSNERGKKECNILGLCHSWFSEPVNMPEEKMMGRGFLIFLRKLWSLGERFF